MKAIILLSTYNGEEYLKEQLESLEKQTIVKNIEIFIRDDGSTDNTIKILNEYVSKYNNIKFYQGENKGTALSFMELLKNADDADYYLFCDQDDVWLERKVEIGINKLSKFENEYALYYSELNVTDERLNLLFKTNYTGIDSVGASYSATPVAGCTLIINRKLKNLIIKKVPEKITMHDIWIYRSCLAVDGIVVHDKDSYILYRQHQDNVVGTYDSLIKKIIEIKNHHGDVVCVAKSILDIYGNLINEENRNIIYKLSKYEKKMNFRKKLNYAFDKKYKSKKFGIDLKFKIYVLFGKI